MKLGQETTTGLFYNAAEPTRGGAQPTTASNGSTSLNDDVHDVMAAAVVRIGETFTSEDSDFLRLKNDITNAFQAQIDLRLASAS